jgi:glutamine synthetase
LVPSQVSLSNFSKKLKRAVDSGAKMVDLQFVDIFGNLKFESVTIDEFKDIKVFSNGIKIDGSSIYGYGVPTEESDLLIIPDPDTFSPVPWTADVWRAICNVYYPRGSGSGSGFDPFEGDSRIALSRLVERIPSVLSKRIDVEGKEFRFYVAPELEFFLLQSCAGGYTRIDDKGYFDAPPSHGRSVLGKIMEAMGMMGIKYEAYHKEVAPGQYEVDFRYGRAVRIADATITIKDIIKQYAYKDEMVATFMPKPFEGMNGSGMHTHQNLVMVENGEKTNLFFDNEKEDLSDIALHYIGGLLKHAKSITAITNPTCNSYKRRTSEAREVDHGDHQPYLQFLQEDDPRMGGPGQHRLGEEEQDRPDQGSIRRTGLHKNRVPLPRSIRQPVHGFHGDARRRAGWCREGDRSRKGNRERPVQARLEHKVPPGFPKRGT